MSCVRRGLLTKPCSLKAISPSALTTCQSPEGCFQLGSGMQHLTGNRSVRVQKVHALIAAQVIRCIGTAMQTLVSQRRERLIDCVGQLSVNEEIHVLGSADDFVRS